MPCLDQKLTRLRSCFDASAAPASRGLWEPPKSLKTKAPIRKTSSSDMAIDGWLGKWSFTDASARDSGERMVSYTGYVVYVSVMMHT